MIAQYYSEKRLKRTYKPKHTECEYPSVALFFTEQSTKKENRTQTLESNLFEFNEISNARNNIIYPMNLGIPHSHTDIWLKQMNNEKPF